MLELIREAARDRVRAVISIFGHPKNKGYGPDREFVGVAGEACFAHWAGIPWNLINQDQGDSGIDFTMPNGLTVDVKTCRIPKWMLVKEGEIKSDVYVLAHYKGDCVVHLCGWRWAHELRMIEPEDKGGKGMKSHFCPRRRLHPMKDFPMWPM